MEKKDLSTLQGRARRKEIKMRLQPSSVLNLDESEDHVEVAKLVESRRDELDAMLQVRVYHALFRIHGFELASSLNRLKVRLVIIFSVL